EFEIKNGLFYLPKMFANGLGYGKLGSKETFSFPSALVARAFCFVIIFIFLITKSKRFGGLSKHDQAHGNRT
ncbi:hypothetical protein, partial [Kriegella aquimaris]